MATVGPRYWCRVAVTALLEILSYALTLRLRGDVVIRVRPSSAAECRGSSRTPPFIWDTSATGRGGDAGAQSGTAGGRFRKGLLDFASE